MLGLLHALQFLPTQLVQIYLRAPHERRAPRIARATRARVRARIAKPRVAQRTERAPHCSSVSAQARTPHEVARDTPWVGAGGS